MIKRLDRVKRVPKKATKYFLGLLDALSARLRDADASTNAAILIVDTEPGYVHFNVEAWETFKFTLRLCDMLPVREGKELSNPAMGWELGQIVDKLFNNLKSWDSYIKLSNSIDKDKQFIINRDTVVEYESNAPHAGGIYLVEFEEDPKPRCMMAAFIQDSKQQWYGYNHEDAVRGALEYQPDRKPLRVSFLRMEKF